jgi:hypothetical protein
VAPKPTGRPDRGRNQRDERIPNLEEGEHMTRTLTSEHAVTNPTMFTAVDGYLRGGLAVLSACAAVIHFAVLGQHFNEYWLFGTFFLVVGWAQATWAVAVPWRPSRALLWVGVLGNAAVLAVWLASRTTGLPIGPNAGEAESVAGSDLTATVLELAVVAGAVALLARPRWTRRRVDGAARALLVAAAALVVVATSAALTPALAGSGNHQDPAVSATNHHAHGGHSGASADRTQDVGSDAPPTTAQIAAADQLIKQVDASLSRYADANAAVAAGYQPVPADPCFAKTETCELHYLNPPLAKPGIDPNNPVGLVYAVHLARRPPVLVGALFVEPTGVTGPQPGGSLTRWHVHTNQGGNANQHLHVWIVPEYPGGPFSADDTLAGRALQQVVDQVP